MRDGAHSGHSIDRRSDYALARPLRWLTFLRYTGWRFGGALDALLLDIRTPRSLYPGHSRLRLPECLGAPHVHGGNDFHREHVLCRFNHVGRRADGHQNLQLARNDLGWEAALCHTDA